MLYDVVRTVLYMRSRMAATMPPASRNRRFDYVSTGRSFFEITPQQKTWRAYRARHIGYSYCTEQTVWTLAVVRAAERTGEPRHRKGQHLCVIANASCADGRLSGKAPSCDSRLPKSASWFTSSSFSQKSYYALYALSSQQFPPFLLWPFLITEMLCTSEGSLPYGG